MRLRSPSSLAGLAAVAIAAAIAAVGIRKTAVVQSGGAGRGSELAAGVPAGPIAAVGEFAWTTPFGRAAYRVTVVDAAGTVRFTTFTSQESVTMPRNQAARLAPGRYSWKVEAFDERGRSLGASPAQPFDILWR